MTNRLYHGDLPNLVDGDPQTTWQTEGYDSPQLGNLKEGVGFTIETGERVALVGTSGSGKTTLARLLARLIEPDAGTIRFEGRDLLSLRGEALRRLRAGFQLVFQDPLASLDPRRRVGSQVADPLRAHRLVPRGERGPAVARLLERVGLDPALAFRFPHEISGGQRERVAIVAAGDDPVWVVGYRIDERVKVTGLTRRLIRLSARKEEMQR